MIGYEARPLIRITPPQDASDRRTKTYNYIEAIKVLPTNFTEAELKSIMSKVNPRLYGRLRALFIVIDDDMERVNSSTSGRGHNGQEDSGSGPGPATGANAVEQSATRSRPDKRKASTQGSSQSAKR